MDDIRGIFASVDGTLPERPFASFTALGGRAAAAGTLSPPDGRHYVAYLEEPSEEAPTPSYVDEALRIHDSSGSPAVAHGEAGGYRMRYLEAFSSAFAAGERYRFFREALRPVPEEDDTEEDRRRDLARGLARVEDLIRRKATDALCDEVLRAEEAGSAAGDPETRAFWRQAALSAREELARLIPEAGRREEDLALHRYRRAAVAADRALDDGPNPAL